VGQVVREQAGGQPRAEAEREGPGEDRVDRALHANAQYAGTLRRPHIRRIRNDAPAPCGASASCRTLGQAVAPPLLLSAKAGRPNASSSASAGRNPTAAFGGWPGVKRATVGMLMIP